MTFPRTSAHKGELRLYCRCGPFASCHSEFFTFCHSEPKAKNLISAQGKLRVAISLAPRDCFVATLLAKTEGRSLLRLTSSASQRQKEVSLQALERCAAISTLTRPTGIAEPVPNRKRGESHSSQRQRRRASQCLLCHDFGKCGVLSLFPTTH